MSRFLFAASFFLAAAGSSGGYDVKPYESWLRDCYPVYSGLPVKDWCPEERHGASSLMIFPGLDWKLSRDYGKQEDQTAVQDGAAQDGTAEDCGCRPKSKGRPKGIKELLEKVRGQ